MKIIRNIMKKDKAITLIALVVTMIILLIIAGVTVGIATNGTGLFEKAKTAADEYNNKAQQEGIELAKASNEIENNINGTRDGNCKFKSILDRTASNYNSTDNGIVFDIDTSWTDKNIDIALTENIENYDLLLLTVDAFYSNWYHTKSFIIKYNELDSNNIFVNDCGDCYSRFELSIVNGVLHINKANCSSVFTKIRIKDVQGIKY